MQQNKGTLKMKKIIIADPCTLLDNHEWADCCKVWQPEDDSVFYDAIRQKLAAKDFIKQVIAVEPTPYGDGAYTVEPTSTACSLHNFDELFTVDTGKFCICEVAQFLSNANPNIAQLECNVDDEIVLKNYASIDEEATHAVAGDKGLFKIVWVEDDDEYIYPYDDELF